MNIRETDEFKRGLARQHEVARALRQERCFVTDFQVSPEGNMRAPRIGTLDGDSIILPDLECVWPNKRGSARIEVKSKGHAEPGRISGKLEHGIGMRLFRAYHRFYKDIGVPVWLCIYEENTQKYLWQQVQNLRPKFYDGKDWGGPGRFSNHPSMDLGGMIYWTLDDFLELTIPQFVAQTFPIVPTGEGGGGGNGVSEDSKTVYIDRETPTQIQEPWDD